MKRIKLIMLQAIKMTLFIGILFSCSTTNKQSTKDIGHIVNDYKNDFYKYKFYKSDTCEALIISIEYSKEGKVIIIQNLPHQNYEFYLGKQEKTTKSEVFGIYDKTPIYLINNLSSKDPLYWVKFDSILNINQIDRINGDKHEIVPLEYEPVLISCYYLDSSTKTLQLQNDSILSFKFSR